MFALLSVLCLFAGANAYVATLQDPVSVYSECVKPGDYAITFGKIETLNIETSK